jgi:hypothetical protein
LRHGRFRKLADTFKFHDQNALDQQIEPLPRDNDIFLNDVDRLLPHESDGAQRHLVAKRFLVT